MAEFAAVSPLNTTHLCFCKSPGPSSHRASFPCRSFPLALSWKNISIVRAKKKKSQVEPPILEPSIIEQVTMEEEEDEIIDQFEDATDKLWNKNMEYFSTCYELNNVCLPEVFQDGDDYFEEYEVEDSEPYVGDGGEGGGISLAGTWWDKEALAIAEEVSQSFDGDLKIYAFKTSANSIIQVRIEKLSNKYGSPSMTDIEEFSSVYRARLDKAEISGSVPENLSLEVSSPGVERIMRIPQDLARFKDRPMYVKYVGEADPKGSFTERDGIFRLVSFDLEMSCCTWGLADVRINREKAGKGRPLSKKQREWRLETPFDSLRLVRLYSDF